MKRKLVGLLVAFFVSAGTLFAIDAFAGGGFNGPSLEPITIADLADAEPNQIVIVAGYLSEQRMPGRFVLVEGDNSVMVRIGAFEWANLDISETDLVYVYGFVLKNELTTEILVERVGSAGSGGGN